MLRLDRVRIGTERLAAVLESIPEDKLLAAAPEGIPGGRLVLAPLVRWGRTSALSYLRSMPARAERNPAETDAWFQHVLAVVAWLDGQTDRMPPLLASAQVIGSPSSADPEPENPPSSAA